MIRYKHPYLTISLLDGCNKVCKHCYRTAIPYDHGFKLSRQQACLSFNDAASLQTACILVGGEPTIWEDGNMDFFMLLTKAAKRHGRVAFLSNGFVFEDKSYADEFVRRYMDECGLPLHMKFSVDFLHENYDDKEERIPFLDNLIEAQQVHSAAKIITLFFISHWTNNTKHNIPLRACEKYAELGIQYAIDDFMVWGRGAELKDLACYIEVDSSDKTTLGPYREILINKMIDSRKIQGEEEFGNLLNREIIKKMSVCGNSPNFYISWGNKYYYCIPQMAYDWFAISDIGKLNQNTVESFFAERPIIKEIQESSIIDILDKYKSNFVGNTLKEINAIKESIRFAGCSICLELSKKGILQEINRNILNTANEK